jgi:hypothetical protein
MNLAVVRIAEFEKPAFLSGFPTTTRRQVVFEIVKVSARFVRVLCVFYASDNGPSTSLRAGK